jgi:hypothetical protein
MLVRASVSIFLAAGILTAVPDSGEAKDFGKVGPPLETVKAYTAVKKGTSLNKHVFLPREN